MAKKVLLMYISENSGHHRACLAIEKALKLKGEDIETLNVNAFNYTNPILEKIIGKTYMSVIRRKPQFWGYLYDKNYTVGQNPLDLDIRDWSSPNWALLVRLH